MSSDIERVLVTERALRERVAEMARDIVDAYPRREDGITIVTILAGSLIFLSDLIRLLPLKMRVGLATVSSYAGPTTESTGAKLEFASFPDLCNRDVLIVDDILETGGTLRVVQEEVRSRRPQSVMTAVLLRKTARAPADLPVDFIGFDIEDVFVIGYGLDYDGFYRNLPHIAVLKPEVSGTRRES